jgi:predicted RNA binding protein YcfA (HicA-like mRNA interferase family)
MGRLEKLISQLRSEPPEASFSDIERLLNAFDFEEIRSRGSHHSFRHKDGRKITLPKSSGRTVKRVYIKKVLRLLGLD